MALQHLSFLVGKHFALRRVHELCEVRQRKWSLAGPLAPLDADEIRRLLAALVGRHLLVREADGSYSVHPAVRDHFSRRGGLSDSEAWHELIRWHLFSLVQRPGKHRPEDAGTLDVVEEAIHHACAAGRAEEGLRLYREVLGGVRHLAWKLGEVTRGLRIFRGFQPCPDDWELAWYLRALGELEEAYRCNELPYFRADLRLLQGRLPEVAAEDEPSRTAIAAFLMGEKPEGDRVPPQPLSCAVPRDQLLVYLGRLAEVRHAAGLERFFHEIGWEGDRVRCLLVQADVAWRQANLPECRRLLDEAASWVLHSGSVEHLSLLHLVTARAARAGEDFETAARAVTDGLHTARQAGLGLYEVELLCEQSQIALAQGEASRAEAAARAALGRATAETCRFLWGAAAAGHWLGQSLVAQGRAAEARTILEKTLAWRRHLGDPGIVQTERLLAKL
jgi:hypothetical protein